MALELMKKINPEQEDPRKKKTLPDVTVVGVRKKPVDLPEVTVEGVRKKVNLPDVAVTSVMKKPVENIKNILSDEYKAKMWHHESENRGYNPERDENALGRIEKGASDYNYSESDYAKKAGPKDKIYVKYSDGSIHKLGENYKPKEDEKGSTILVNKSMAPTHLQNVKPTAGKYLKGGGKSWLEWYQSKRAGKED